MSEIDELRAQLAASREREAALAAALHASWDALSGSREALDSMLAEARRRGAMAELFKFRRLYHGMESVMAYINKRIAELEAGR